MKIATYNINGINGRLDTLLTWLAETQPDIVCLQELKAPQAKFPEKKLAEAGYGAVWHPKFDKISLGSRRFGRQTGRKSRTTSDDRRRQGKSHLFTGSLAVR